MPLLADADNADAVPAGLASRFLRKMPCCFEFICPRDILPVHRAGKNQTGAQNQSQNDRGVFHVMPPGIGTLVSEAQHSDRRFAA